MLVRLKSFSKNLRSEAAEHTEAEAEVERAAVADLEVSAAVWVAAKFHWSVAYRVNDIKIMRS